MKNSKGFRRRPNIDDNRYLPTYFALNTQTNEIHTCESKKHAVCYAKAANKRLMKRDVWQGCMKTGDGFVWLDMGAHYDD